MTVYIITKGDYSDYHICTVTLDKEKAEKLAKMYSDRYDDAEVEEYEVDCEADVNMINDRNPYKVYFYKNNAPWVYRETYELQSFKHGAINARAEGPLSDVNMVVSVFAENEEKAFKIAADKRAKYLAEKAGIV